MNFGEKLVELGVEAFFLRRGKRLRFSDRVRGLLRQPRVCLLLQSAHARRVRPQRLVSNLDTDCHALVIVERQRLQRFQQTVFVNRSSRCQSIFDVKLEKPTSYSSEIHITRACASNQSIQQNRSIRCGSVAIIVRSAFGMEMRLFGSGLDHMQNTTN